MLFPVDKKACFYDCAIEKSMLIGGAKKACFLLEDRMKLRYCPCGSGEQREPQFDGYGIFLCYTCPRCHTRKMAMFRHDIMERYACDEPIEQE
jgi:hypothetical protein